MLSLTKSVDVGLPETSLADAVQAMSRSRAIGHAVTLINTLCLSGRTNIHCGNYTTARAELTEGIALSGEKREHFLEGAGHREPRCGVGFDR